jgi:protein-disulfide isomerase
MGNRFVVIIVSAFLLAAPLAAQEPMNRNQLDEILAELRQIRNLLKSKLDMERAQALIPPAGAVEQTRTVAVEVGNSPFLGSKDAPLTIVEFADFQCAYCRRFHEDTFVDLKKNYIDSGKVRIYHMDLPLAIHQNALLTAQAGRCAGDQGRFWAMHDRMLANPNRLELSDLTEYAQEFSLDLDAFRKCMEGGKYRDDIQQGARYAMTKGVRGTPTFVIGKSTPTGVDGELVVGAQPYGVFDKKLKELIQ